MRRKGGSKHREDLRCLLPPHFNPDIQTHESPPATPQQSGASPRTAGSSESRWRQAFLPLPFCSHLKETPPQHREKELPLHFTLSGLAWVGDVKGATEGRVFPKRPPPSAPASRGEKKRASPSYLSSAFAPSGSRGSRSLVAKPDPPRSSRSQSSLKTPAEEGQRAPHSARPLRGLTQGALLPSEEERPPQRHPAYGQKADAGFSLMFFYGPAPFLPLTSAKGWSLPGTDMALSRRS